MKIAAKSIAMLLSALALAASGPAQAYEGPWCAVINLGIGSASERCGFPSFETCQREARIYGSSSFCRTNGGFGTEPRPQRKKKRRAQAR